MPDLIVVFHSTDRARCDDRAFMLQAVGIPALVEIGERGFELSVPSRQAAFAMHHLWRYEHEQWRPPAALPPPVYPHAWTGSALYAALLALVAWLVVQGLALPDAFARGALDVGAFQTGQWWRAITALTLHWDIVHLVMNLLAGGAIGWLAARQLGPGLAWLLSLLAAALANIVEATVAMPPYLSAGASTLVFALLGLLATHSWQRQAGALTWARRAAPLVAGIVLLGLLGSGGGSGASGSVVDADQVGTDLIAHVLGFATGALFGVIAASPRVASLLARFPQWIAGTLALSMVALSWILALTA